MLAVLLLLLLPLLTAHAQPQLRCFDPVNSSPPRELVLCGNGVLDAGEVCDDGNQVDGDGCSAFCTHFDSLTAAATLAGGNAACPVPGRPVLGGTTSNVRFCNLLAIETSLDGAYAILADGGQLLRFDLFTDTTTTSGPAITQMQAGILGAFTRICSLGALFPDGLLLFHDCARMQFYVTDAAGAQTPQLASDLSGLLQPSLLLPLKTFYNRTARSAVTAGVPIDSAASGLCVLVYALQLSAPSATAFVSTTTRLLATIPCTLYGVWENGARITSFDVRDMLPYLVTRERCPPTFRSGQFCYAVHMQRPAHLEFLRAYVVEDGGIDLQYYSETTNLYDNALGAPLVRYGQSNNNLVYTLRGACFQVESRVVTSAGKSPPVATLGNACKRAPMLGLGCATPLNNPFLTDAVTSQVLLPQGLSATHTHAELSLLLGASCRQLSNVTTAGPLLYRSVLRNVYGNTTPVDFVEHPGTLDVLYITPTSVGLISTKRVLLQDQYQPGYARATNALYCPPGRFGAVGGVCRNCTDAAAPGYYTSVPWQMYCTTATTATTSPPFETFTLIASRNTTQDVVHAGVCLFAQGRGGDQQPCPPALQMLPLQPFNVAANLLEAGLAPPTADQDLFLCLLAALETAIVGRAHPAEYNTRVVSPGGLYLTSAAAAAAAKTTTTTTTPILQSCRGKLSRGVGAFLSCAIPQIPFVLANDTSTTSTNDTTNARRRRRLLQAAVPSGSNNNNLNAYTEHQGVSAASSTTISWSRTLPNGSNPINNNNNGNANANNGGDNGFPLWIGVTIGIVSVLVVGLLLYLLLSRRGHSSSSSRAAAKTTTDTHFIYYHNIDSPYWHPSAVLPIIHHQTNTADKRR